MKSFGYPKFPSNIPHFMERVNTYCARVLPLVFDNSLSYYEFLGHMQHKLNEVIEALNSQNLVFVEFTHMIELEMKHFESYIEERQQNFEESMQQEWDAFKTEIQGEWAAFKTEMQQAWADEQALNAQFRADMQQAFTNFQNVITTQQSAFETAIRNQQNQFQTDMTSRQNTFEDTMEGNFEQWKVDTLAALHAGIQQFEQDTLTAIENEIQQLIAENGGAMITAVDNAVEGEQINVDNYAVSKYVGSALLTTDLFSSLTNETIIPHTCYIFDSSAAWDFINHIMLAKTAPDYPASGWTAHIGVYSSDSPSLANFHFSEIVETNSAAMQQGSMDMFGGYGGRSTKKYHWFCIWFTYSTPDITATFTCDLTDKIFCYGADNADITIQDKSTEAGIKYLIGKSYPMDSAPTSGHTNNVVSSAGIYNELAQKQNALTTAQTSAVNSGITAQKVSNYDTALCKAVTLNGSNYANFNYVANSGYFKYINGPTNNPDNSNTSNGILIVLSNDSYVAQLCFSFESNKLFVRHSLNNGTSWNAWNSWT